MSASVTPHSPMRAPCRDVAAHRAGADDMDVFYSVAAACKLLHLLAQEKHPDQVLRRRRDHEIGEGTFLLPP